MRAAPLLLLMACAAPAPPPAPRPAIPVAPPKEARTVDVDGVQVELTAFVAARYANVTEISVHATREGTTHESTTAKSSFVLTFGADGLVTGCRGQRVASYLDGGKVSHETRYQEQQGYSGRWKRGEPWVDVELEPDNKTCPQLRRFVDLEPKPWRLRCLSVARAGPLSSGGLVCQKTNRAESQFDEEWGHTLSRILPDRWLVLGPGNGLRVTWREEGVGLHTEKNAVVGVTPAAAPIALDAWK